MCNIKKGRCQFALPCLVVLINSENAEWQLPSKGFVDVEPIVMLFPKMQTTHLRIDQRATFFDLAPYFERNALLISR